MTSNSPVPTSAVASDEKWESERICLITTVMELQLRVLELHAERRKQKKVFIMVMEERDNKAALSREYLEEMGKKAVIIRDLKEENASLSRKNRLLEQEVDEHVRNLRNRLARVQDDDDNIRNVGQGNKRRRCSTSSSVDRPVTKKRKLDPNSSPPEAPVTAPKERTIVCIRCYQNNLLCDNDPTCKQCVNSNASCMRAMCANFTDPEKCTRRHCTRAHYTDTWIPITGLGSSGHIPRKTGKSRKRKSG